MYIYNVIINNTSINEPRYIILHTLYLRLLNTKNLVHSIQSIVFSTTNESNMA